MKLDAIPLLVVIWGQPGCGHCEDFIPPARKLAAANHPTIPVHVVNVNEVYAASEKFKVASTPTVTVIRFGKKTHELVGPTPTKFAGLLRAVEAGRV